MMALFTVFEFLNDDGSFNRASNSFAFKKCLKRRLRSTQTNRQTYVLMSVRHSSHAYEYGTDEKMFAAIDAAMIFCCLSSSQRSGAMIVDASWMTHTLNCLNGIVL
jgi:hypothetical protein